MISELLGVEGQDCGEVYDRLLNTLHPHHPPLKFRDPVSMLILSTPPTSYKHTIHFIYYNENHYKNHSIFHMPSHELVWCQLVENVFPHKILQKWRQPIIITCYACHIHVNSIMHITWCTSSFLMWVKKVFVNLFWWWNFLFGTVNNDPNPTQLYAIGIICVLCFLHILVCSNNHTCINNQWTRHQCNSYTIQT